MSLWLSSDFFIKIINGRFGGHFLMKKDVFYQILV